MNGVVIRKVEQAGRISYVLSDEDPQRTSYFGLNTITHSIVCLLDGAHKTEEIGRIIKETHGIECTQEQVDAVLRTLQENNLLEGSSCARPRPAQMGAQRKVARALARLIQVWFLFRADRLLAALEPLIALMARPVALFVWIVSGVLGFASIIVFMRQDVIAMAVDLRHASRPELLAILAGTYAARFLIGICHEIAHGATCRYFGGRNIRMGAGFYYFAPVFVCDTSSAWLIEKKRNRILVSLAGPLCQMGFGACGAGLFLLPLPYSVRVMAIILMAVGYGENLLMDFNPLLRYDGYYILADLLEMPNLRARSFAHLWRLFFGGWQAVTSTWERNVYLVYGTLALCYTIFVLFGVSIMMVSLARRGAMFLLLLVSLGLVILSMIMHQGTRHAQG
jgi:putative peptide zinc metalloprotease protein